MIQIDMDLPNNCYDCPYCYDFILCRLGGQDLVNIDVDPQKYRPGFCALKEQCAVKPKSKSRKGEYPQIVHRCGNCNQVLYRYYKYCPSCGKQVKWKK